MPQRSVRLLLVSTVSVGTVNSAVAVDPSVTVIVVGLNVIAVTVAAKHGFDTSIVIETALGVNEVVEP